MERHPDLLRGGLAIPPNCLTPGVRGSRRHAARDPEPPKSVLPPGRTLSCRGGELCSPVTSTFAASIAGCGKRALRGSSAAANSTEGLSSRQQWSGVGTPRAMARGASLSPH